MHLVRANAQVSQPKNDVQWVSTNAPHNNIHIKHTKSCTEGTYVCTRPKSTSNFEKYENANARQSSWAVNMHECLGILKLYMKEIQ